MTTRQIQESATQSDGVRVDRQAGIIYGVKVCGNRSKNGRIYPPEVLLAAVPLYEDVSVYIDHGSESGEERPMKSLFGSIREPRMQNGELFADLHYIKSHSDAEKIVELAERFPRRFGLSHDIYRDWESDGANEVITKILKVHSVDIVTRPATNEGIFEQEQTKPMKKKRTFRSILVDLPAKQYPGKFRVMESMENAEDPMIDMPVEIEENEASGMDADAAIMAALEQALVAICKDANLDRKTKLKKLGDVLKQQETLVGGGSATPSQEADDEPIDDEEEPSDDAGKPAKESQTVKQLRRDVADLKAQLAKSGTDAAIESVIRELELEDTPQLRETLGHFKTAAEMKRYMDGHGDYVGPVRESVDGMPSVLESDRGGGETLTREQRLKACHSGRTY